MLVRGWWFVVGGGWLCWWSMGCNRRASKQPSATHHNHQTNTHSKEAHTGCERDGCVEVVGLWFVVGGWWLVVGGCVWVGWNGLKERKQPLATHHRPPNTNQQPLTNQPFCIKCGLPILKGLVGWLLVCGGWLVVSGWWSCVGLVGWLKGSRQPPATQPPNTHQQTNAPSRRKATLDIIWLVGVIGGCGLWLVFGWCSCSGLVG